MRATAGLFRWQQGWHAIDSDEEPGIEICQGHSGDSSEILHKAVAEIATYKFGQTEITVGIDVPPGDPVPGVDWTAGDELDVTGAGSGIECEALTMSLDDQTGRWTDMPQFGAILDAPEKRIDRTLKSIGGITGGTSHLARPVARGQEPGTKPAQ